MPPRLAIPEAESCNIVTAESTVEIVDTSALSLVPLPGDDGESGSARLINCIENSRQNHMMTHPQSSQDDADEDESGEEEPEAEEDDDAEGEESEEEDAEDDDEEDG